MMPMLHKLSLSSIGVKPQAMVKLELYTVRQYRADTSE